MGNKCKICGYRFKDKDEAICPECFTARDDDISCERYSASEHSHGSSYSSGLRDTGESFVQRELRLERNNQFARENFGDRASYGVDMTDHRSYNDPSRFARSDYAPAHQQPAAPGQEPSAYLRYIAQQQRKGGFSQSGFTPAGQILAQRNASGPQRSMFQEYRAIRQPSNTPKKKGSGAAAVVFLMVFILAFIVTIISQAQEEREEREWNEQHAQTEYAETQSTSTTTASTTKQAATTTLKSKVDTTMGNYSCEIIDFGFTPKKTSEIDKELISYATDFTHQEEPWAEVTVKVRVSPGTNYSEIQKDPTVTNASLQGIEKATSNTSMSYSTVRPDTKIELSEDGTAEVTLTLIAHKDAKILFFNLYLQGAGAKESCRFRITV